MILALDLPQEAIAALCRQHGVQELSLFGSALHGNFNAESDVDFLVRFLNDDAGPWMSKYQALQDDLSRLLGRKVDLVSRRAVEENPNWLIRNEILNSARVLYES